EPFMELSRSRDGSGPAGGRGLEALVLPVGQLEQEQQRVRVHHEHMFAWRTTYVLHLFSLGPLGGGGFSSGRRLTNLTLESLGAWLVSFRGVPSVIPAAIGRSSSIASSRSSWPRRRCETAATSCLWGRAAAARVRSSG